MADGTVVPGAGQHTPTPKWRAGSEGYLYEGDAVAGGIYMVDANQHVLGILNAHDELVKALRVLLEMAAKCDDCDGVGEFDDEENDFPKCDICDGTGKLSLDTVPEYAAARDALAKADAR